MTAHTSIIRTLSLLSVLGGVCVGVWHNDRLHQRIIDEWQLNPHMAVRDADYDLSKLLASMEKRVMIGTFGTDASQLEHDLEVLRYQLALTQTDAYRGRFSDIPEALNVLDDTSRDIEQFYGDIMGLRPGDVDAFSVLQDQLIVHRDALTRLVDHSKDWSQNRLADIKRERTRWTMIQYGLLGLAALLSFVGLRRKSDAVDVAHQTKMIAHEACDDGSVMSAEPTTKSGDASSVFESSPASKRLLLGALRSDVLHSGPLLSGPIVPELAPRGTKSGTDPISVVPAPMNIAGIVDDVMRAAAPWAVHRHISLACTIDPDVPGHITASGAQIAQIMRHLVGNAVKFTHQGGIVVAADMTAPLGHQNAELRFSVLDTGAGIEPGYRDLIFGPQVQVEPEQAVDFSAFDAEQQGRGNGLAIVRQLVTRQGGQVGVESKPGLGSKFWFTVPIEAPGPCIGADIDARHHQILLVDSDAVRSEAVADQCQAFGADVMIAEHSFAAIEAIMLRHRENGPQQGCYDLMLIAAPHGVQPLLPLLRQISQLEAAPHHIAIAVPEHHTSAVAGWQADIPAVCHMLTLPIYAAELIGLLGAICQPRQLAIGLRA